MRLWLLFSWCFRLNGWSFGFCAGSCAVAYALYGFCRMWVAFAAQCTFGVESLQSVSGFVSSYVTLSLIIIIRYLCWISSISDTNNYASIRQRCPLGAIRKKLFISISSSPIPSLVDILACGKARKNSTVARRSSLRARWIPIQARDSIQSDNV